MAYIQSNWGNGIAEWVEGNTAFVSSVFSWNAQEAFMRCVYYKNLGYKVRVGGPTTFIFPEIFSGFDTEGDVKALLHHNPSATFTSRGCVRNCPFCIVPKMEGDLIELNNWDIKPIICDNNLLATSKRHFDSVIDKLIENDIRGIDFNQGLDARLLNEYHAFRLAQLPKDTIIRLAWDWIEMENVFLNALSKLNKAGISKKQIRAYILIGYKDTPRDALYRLEKTSEYGVLPNPMRYQPLNTKRKNEFVGNNWSNRLLNKFVRYWSNLKLFRNISFEEYTTKKIHKIPKNQISLFKNGEL